MSTELGRIFQNARDARHESLVWESNLVDSIPSIGQDISDEAGLANMVELPHDENYNAFQMALYFSKPKLSADQVRYVENTLNCFLAIIKQGQILAGKEREITVGDIRQMDGEMLTNTGLTLEQQRLMLKLFRKVNPVVEVDLNPNNG